MKIKYGILSCCVLLIGISSICWEDPREQYPQDYFLSPVDHTIRLSGTFGELRSNHFHSGIDIKPAKGGSGDPIFAAAAGKIVRINVSAGGFGNALYIQHPNGYTTVYAHLDRFMPKVAEYVKKRQYELKSFAVNLYPENQFPVNQKEQIGTMGNSGSSTGAHLHFEIRKSSNSKPINPLLFGLDINDEIRPKIKNVVIYELDQFKTILNQSIIPIDFDHSSDTLYVNTNKVGIGIQTYDMMNHLKNKNGVYNIELFENQNPVYSILFESFHFSESRYINAHTDFAHYQSTRQMVHRLYNLPGNQFSLCQPGYQDGVISLDNQEVKNVSVVIKDINGNEANREFVLKKLEVKEHMQAKRTSNIFRYDQENSINESNFNLNMPAGTLYEDLPIEYLEVKDKSDGMLSSTFLLNEAPIPAHKYFDIKIKPDTDVGSIADKAFIAQCNSNGTYVNCGGQWEGGYLSTRIRSFGSYVIMIDTISPTIQPIKFAKDMRDYKSMSFVIKDNLSVSGRAKGLKYHATVDGKWILFEHDGKKDKIFHTFDGRIQPGEHLLKITVTDDRNNVNVFKQTFTR